VGPLHCLIDSHVHLCLLSKHNPDRIAWLPENCCTVISWAFGGDIGTVSDLKHYFSYRLSTFRDLRRRGLDCYDLCGIHPRKIPPDLRPEAVADILTPFLETPECLGIGEIGLETGSSLEQEILCAQLEFGLALGRPDIRFGIHTPRKEKASITARLLRLLEAYKALPAVTVIDHCNREIIGSVLSGGYHAGISLSRTKSTEAELNRMLRCHAAETDKIMCNTDSGRDFFEDLVLTALSGEIDRKIAENVFYNTAARFFGIPAENHKK
jgi:predicted metal-dependent TIM-barrel fold hydrolase